MSLRLDLLSIVDAVRSIAGVDALDQRTHQLTIRTRTWSGARLKQGTATDVDLVLPQKFPVRVVNASEVSSSGGLLEMSDILVDHITPSNGAAVGFTPLQLKPYITTHNVEVVYILSGPKAGEYGLIELRAYRPYTYQLILRRTIATP